MLSVIPKRYFHVLLVLIICVFGTTATGQGISTEGKDFWVGYLTNWLQSSNNPVILELYISADDTTRGTVTMPRQASLAPMAFEVFPNTTKKITIPTSLGMATGSNIVEGKGLHIETDNVISVYAMNKRQYSADMTVVLPTYSLGNNYFVMSHWEDGNRNNNANSDSEFLIVAITDDTEVEITPTNETREGNPANVPFRVTLQKGQTYQVQAQGDLTGTQITATSSSDCQNFAVFSGNMYTQVGECNVENGHDHLYAQMYPTNTLGKDFIVVPLENRYGGDIIKLLATKDNTTIDANGTKYQLNAGEFVKILSASILNVSSDKPISVGQFSRTMDCDGTLGDPFLIPISPNEQMLKKITFNAPSIATLSRYSLNIVAKQASASSITFDGNTIGNQFISIPGSEYAYARLNTTGGNHTIRSDEGFIAYVYGFGQNESFGYATGASLGNLNIDFVVEDQNQATPIDSLCLGSPIFFTPEVDSLYKYFEYDFGDGQTFYSEEDTAVYHYYANPGEYLVSLTATTGNDDCSNGNEEVSKKIIRVIEPEVTISGPRSVCPNTTEVAYYIKENIEHQVRWFVNGGTIQSYSEDSILVNWLGTKADANVQAVVTNRYGCVSDTIDYPVRINIQLDPESPFGPDTLCSNDLNGIPYFTYYTNVSTYQWETDFGTISEGNGTNQVSVDWKSYGNGKLWFSQLSVTDTVCDGVSDTLLVYIQRDPSTIGQISVPADTFLLGETIVFSLEIDTLYRFANWELDDGFVLDTADVNDPLFYVFQCDGWHKIQAVAYDTGTVCSDTKVIVEKNVYIMPPDVEIINVTKSDMNENALEINFILDNQDFYDKEYYLYRRKAGEDSWTLAGTFNAAQSSFTDPDLDISDNSYEYRIETNLDCENKIASKVHQSILLRSEPEDTTASLYWNNYLDWQHGVDHYEIWVSIDSGEYKLLKSTSELSFTYLDKNEGFDHCFMIKAIEQDGNQSRSVSNTSCVAFIPEIKTYNVITPNPEDVINEYFTIDNIEHYPNSRLVILNRYGRTIYQATGYQNNWNGNINGKLSPPGTYYYELELNEPRNEVKSVRGYFSILY
jgi:gliding motility-associated-like protein